MACFPTSLRCEGGALGFNAKCRHRDTATLVIRQPIAIPRVILVPGPDICRGLLIGASLERSLGDRCKLPRSRVHAWSMRMTARVQCMQCALCNGPLIGFKAISQRLLIAIVGEDAQDLDGS